MTAILDSSPTAASQPMIEGSRVPLMIGALHALILANSMQIAAGLAGIDPSPPTNVLPLLAATTAIGVAAVSMVRAGKRLGLGLGVTFCLLSMIGMGPHKLLLEDGAIIAPMAIVGFAFEVAFIRAAIIELRNRT